MHFERMAAAYAAARPPYPDVVFETLEAEGVIGPDIRVLEIGAGSGLATRELVARGSDVVALEPGPQLAALLHDAGAGVEVLPSRLEDAQLADADFDSVVAATAMHWVDLSVGLPKIHRALRPGGWLAVWRNVFGDDRVQTPFRRRVDEIVAKRPHAEHGRGRDQRPTMGELAADGWFEPVRTARWRWSIDLSAAQIGDLFRTFSNWTTGEAAAAEAAASDLGGQVTEHYQSVLHLLRRAPRAT
ncbi:class I SAM-dependent methyltransferase [Microbacterium sp.]|uniref:class I SAM-dependent methyltransferase n=1 Tax=Microbacterium sp. TaxID=51671 RepID=UPI0025FB1C27|nr:class I SAM-dependent methyltransferase [Microbacterium sp.]